MASIDFTIAVRNSQGANYGDRMTGLTPTWAHLKRLSDNTDVTPPAITEVANGQYRFSFDAEANGDVTGQIDCGAALPAHSDRYIDVQLTREPSRIITNLDALVSVGPLDLVDGIEPALTLREAIRGMVADAIGDRVVSGASLETKSLNGAKTRATGTTNDATGERTVTARDLT